MKKQPRKENFSKNNRATLIKNGDDFIQKFTQAIESAEEKILLHTYIFTEDEATKPIIDALLKKASEGVKVFMLLDAFGTPELGDDLKDRLEKANVHWAYFSRLIGQKFEHIGRRLHQKVLTVDNKIGIVGGINLSKEFLNPDGAGPWLDYSLLIEGEEVYRLQKKTIKLYQKAFPDHFSYFKLSLKKFEGSFEEAVDAQTVVNDFMRFKTEVRDSYLDAINNAQKSIKMTATYFLPGKRFLKALKKASKRGVKIELIFSQRSDVKLERWSSRHLYSWYLSNNFKIYEWTESIVHAKAALIDDEWVTIGSYNHNYISRYACLEINIVVRNKAFAQRMNQEFERIKEKSYAVERQGWSQTKKTPIVILYYLSYLISNMITLLSMVFITRKKEKIDMK